MIQEQNLSKEQGLQVIRACFADMIEEAEGFPPFIPQSAFPDLELDEQRMLGQDYIQSLEGQARIHCYDAGTRSHARHSLASRGIALDQQPQAMQIDLLNGMVRALIEQQRLLLQRLDDRLSPFHAADPLFTHQGAAIASSTFAIQPSTEVPVSHMGPTLGSQVITYLSTHENRWRLRTYKARVWQLGYLVQYLGEERPIASVTSADIRSFRDGILCLRANHGRSRKLSFHEKQTENVAARIAPKTAALIFEPCKAFFRWAKSTEGVIERNPAEDVRMLVEVAPKGKKPRRPFSSDELLTLFSAPVFTGHKSRHRRLQPGTVLIKDARFWVPILAFYTGCRLGELIQLHLNDVDVDGPIPYLSINEDRPQGGDIKHLKSKAAVRIVPLHPDVMELGFRDFVRNWKKLRKGSHRLFAEIKFGSDGNASGEFSKIFARQMSLTGLEDPALCFHSFRHNAEDAFRDALQQQYVIDKIIGHDDGATSGVYGQGISLEVAYGAVKAMKHKVSVPDIVKVMST